MTFNNGLPGHWIVGGGSARWVRRYVLSGQGNEKPGAARRVGTATVSGFSLVVYKFPPFPAGGPNGGHVLVLGRVGGEQFFASLHGLSQRLDATKMAVGILRAAARR